MSYRGLSLTLMAVAGCTSLDDVRSRPAIWEATYAASYDSMASCIAEKIVSESSVTPLLYPKERRAVLVVGLPTASAHVTQEYDIRQVTDSATRVTFRRRTMLISEVDRTSRERADSCARA